MYNAILLLKIKHPMETLQTDALYFTHLVNMRVNIFVFFSNNIRTLYLALCHPYALQTSHSQSLQLPVNAIRMFMWTSQRNKHSEVKMHQIT